MTERRFGETDHEPLAPDDILAEALGRLPGHEPARDLWPGVASRIDRRGAASRPSFTWTQLAAAASLLIAVSSGLTWLAARPPAAPSANETVVLAESEVTGTTVGQAQLANFADDQFNAAVTDLEQILRSDRDRLDPRTVMVIERNLQTIDAAIAEARRALDNDPANPYLNSHLADARRRKLDLLRRATELASTEGN